MAGTNPNYSPLTYNLEQLNAVTEDTGGGVMAFRTTGGGGGGGDATAANQLTQIAAEQATANSVSNIEGMTADIRTSTINIESSSASIQTTNAANNVLLTSIDSDTSLINASTATMNTNIAQLKGSLVTMASVNWTAAVVAPGAKVPAGRMAVAFINTATGLPVLPYLLGAGAQALMTGDEKLAASNISVSPSVVTYTNCASKGADRYYTAALFSAPLGVTSIDIYYAGAH